MGAVMLQGTGSDVGKSVLVAGLCRALANRGLRVRPFKPQNMSNNAAVTADGGEIGRAQATQAIACRTEPTTDMNPVLLKPQADHTSQLIVHGQVRGTLRPGNFRQARGALLEDVLASYHRLRAECDVVVVEGAGSPAEINLRAGDIANMGFARAAGVPVVLVGDIDRGGVIAAIVGTRAVIDPDDAAMIRGFLINKFRGDPALFEDGYRLIEQLAGWRGFGVVPWLAPAARLPSEDAVILERPIVSEQQRIVIACPITPRIANFDDLDPLKLEPGVEVRMIAPGQPIPAEAALVVLAGSKATIATLLSYAPKDGTSIFWRTTGAVAMCWACAAGIKCWATRSAIHTGRRSVRPRGRAGPVEGRYRSCRAQDIGAGEWHCAWYAVPGLRNSYGRNHGPRYRSPGCPHGRWTERRCDQRRRAHRGQLRPWSARSCRSARGMARAHRGDGPWHRPARCG